MRVSGRPVDSRPRRGIQRSISDIGPTLTPCPPPSPPASSQVPTASCTVEGSPALNRVRWNHTGREIAVGDSDGQVLVYEVGEVSVALGLFSAQRWLWANVSSGGR